MRPSLRPALAALVLAAACAGCATAPAGSAAGTAAAPANPNPAAAPANPDPWEAWNRKVFAFNEAVDKAVLAPVARAYRDHVPAIVRTSVSNVLGNIYDVWSAANHLLQGKVQTGLEMGMRVVANTVFGAGGIMDPATEMGLVRRSEDFGQTLGRWGLGNGPFVVLPLLGPSTVRDTAGTVADRLAAPSALPQTDAGQWAVTGVEIVNTRTQLLEAGALVDQVALDKYVFLRDGYLARRRDAVHDGAAPMEAFEDFDDEPAPAKAPAAAASAAAPAKAASAGAPAAAASAAASRGATTAAGTPPAAATPALPASAPR